MSARSSIARKARDVVAETTTGSADLKLPFGRTPDGRMVTVEAVERGLDCDCVCPKCNVALVAAKGDVYRHHFRHHIEHACNARETALHLFAKQVICDRLRLHLPDPVGVMVRATPEMRIGAVVADVLCEYDSGTSVAIEIFVAHQVPENKVRYYNTRRQAAVEIDLRPYRFNDMSEAEWERVIIDAADREWLSPPEYIRRAQEIARRKQLAAERAEAARQRAAMEQAERERIARMQYDEERRAWLLERAQEEQKKWEAERLRDIEVRAKRDEAQRVTITRLCREMEGPSLQQLVEIHGGYHRIPEEAWAAHHQVAAEWRQRVQTGDFYLPPYWGTVRGSSL